MRCRRQPQVRTPFRNELVRLPLKKQKRRIFSRLIDGVPLAENVANLNWLHRTHPEANFLPKAQIGLTSDSDFIESYVY